MNTTLAPAAVRTARFTALLLALALCGCRGHGKYTQAGVNAAQERVSQMKSANEYQMAHQQYLAGELDKALKSVDNSISMTPKVVKCHVLRGRILIEKAELELARDSLLTAEELDPACVDAQYFLGIIHERFSQPEHAMVRYWKAAELDKTNAQYVIATAEMLIQLDRLDDAEEFLDQRREQLQFNAAVRQCLGHIAMLRADYKAGGRLMREAMLLAPDDISIQEDLARAQVACAEYADAEFNLRRLLENEKLKDRRDLKHLHARCLIALDRPVEARTILLELTADSASTGADDVNAWIDLGHVAYILDDKARAREAAARVLAIAPQRYEGHFLRALQLRRAGDLPGAVKALEHAVALSGNDCQPLLLLSLIQQELGQPDAARQTLSAIIALDPKNDKAQRLLAAIDARAGTAIAQPIER
jgi:Flp pilus assembly protein TadD